jgi:hypothetical protein
LHINLTEDREVRRCDFDEDLSELEEEDIDDEDCECSDGDSECGCRLEDGDEDDGSTKSYDGSDADYYYELKEEREERKQEKLLEQKEKERQRDIDINKEEEVRVAYKSLSKFRKERETVGVGMLAGQSFKLFCSDHVDIFYSDSRVYGTKRVEFHQLDNTEIPDSHKLEPGNETDVLYGDVYLDADANCGFGPFSPPKRASRKTFKVKSCDGMYELSFKFIGNGYLKLRVSREMVFLNPYIASPRAPPATAPETFEFVGIQRDLEKERAERRAIRRPPSPRESWFEMNHPMGSWHWGRYF